MRNLMRAGIGLVIVAILAWGYAVLDGLGPDRAVAGSALVPGELASYPGADDIVARRVWAGDEVDVLGRPSRDGRWLSYVDWAGGGNLAIRDLRTGESRIVTDKQGGWATDEYALRSVFSPDGSRIVYQWWNPEAFAFDLYVAELESGETRRIVEADEGLGFVQPIEWVAGGDDLLVLHRTPDGVWQLGFLGMSSAELRILRSLDWRGPKNVALSPDGDWIAYDLPREDDPALHDVVLLAVDGSRESVLSESEANELVVGWLPGGGSLFYLSESGGTARLLAQAVDGPRPVGAPRIVRSDLVNAWPMGSFDGGFLFGVFVEASHVRTGSVDLASGALTSPPAPVARSHMERSGPAEWSRDGERLVYVVNPPLGGAFPVSLAVRSVRTGAEQRFATPLGYVISIALGPEGDEVLVQGYGPRGRNGIHRMRIGSGEVETLVEVGRDVDQARIPHWSSDGRSVFYVVWSKEDGDVERIVTRDLESGETRTLLEVEGLRSFAVSPDDRELAVARKAAGSAEFGLFVVELHSGEERELLRIPDPDGLQNGSHLTWSPDGEYILFVRSSPSSDGTDVLRMISIRGGEDRVIETDDWVRRPRFHPDGRRIAVTAGVNQAEVWTLENVGAVVEEDR